MSAHPPIGPLPSGRAAFSEIRIGATIEARGTVDAVFDRAED